MDEMPNMSNLSTNDRDKILTNVKQQLAMAQAQELLQKISDKCFSACITKPSTSLSRYEETCLGNCMDRYMESWRIVSKSFMAKAQESQFN
ncbi:hypothetical protein SNEBB_008060 [Seison nebaliae]|nr:hypothetical protein SNEBB_008060 [Seison nebaliae]